jgi:hypothetical protein
MFIITWLFSMAFALTFAICGWVLGECITLFKLITAKSGGGHTGWIPKYWSEKRPLASFRGYFTYGSPSR